MKFAHPPYNICPKKLSSAGGCAELIRVGGFTHKLNEYEAAVGDIPEKLALEWVKMGQK